MGLSLSKENPEAELRKFFKREMKGRDQCLFTGSLKKYNSSTLQNFEEWLLSNKYTFISGQDYVEDTFTYTITKSK